jgi:phosphopantothenoylcysteine decarboxylase/phosphopantothenate--cysteine ligase|tara:strand:+ start:2169 stop:3338 length:1170 start_codon:yes stop_codon:yes gene_type:complete
MKKIVLIISGSIAAKKIYELIKLFDTKKIMVTCVLTNSAIKFVNKNKLKKISNNKIYYKNLFNYDHINLSRNHDVVLICPASANIIAKCAQGFADDFASTFLLASNKPLFIAPAMNKEMWNNFSTQKNVKQLQNNGVNFIGPVNGNLACGEIGNGRLEKLEIIAETINYYVKAKKLLKNKKVVITSGPTQSYIDPIRFISNNSSGKQGFAIAKILSYLGCKVYLVSGPTNNLTPDNVNLKKVIKTQEMYKQVLKLMPCDIAIFTAAVTDFEIKKLSYNKISKKNLTKISLVKSVDIIKKISKLKKLRPKLVIGFAAETKNLIKNSKKKKIDKGCDWILANKVSKKNPAFASDNNKITFIYENKSENWRKMSKLNIAKKLSDKIIRFFQN